MLLSVHIVQYSFLQLLQAQKKTVVPQFLWKNEMVIVSHVHSAKDYHIPCKCVQIFGTGLGRSIRKKCPGWKKRRVASSRDSYESYLHISSLLLGEKEIGHH